MCILVSAYLRPSPGEINNIHNAITEELLH